MTRTIRTMVFAALCLGPALPAAAEFYFEGLRPYVVDGSCEKRFGTATDDYRACLARAIDAADPASVIVSGAENEDGVDRAAPRGDLVEK